MSSPGRARVTFAASRAADLHTDTLPMASWLVRLTHPSASYHTLFVVPHVIQTTIVPSQRTPGSSPRSQRRGARSARWPPPFGHSPTVVGPEDALNGEIPRRVVLDRAGTGAPAALSRPFCDKLVTSLSDAFRAPPRTARSRPRQFPRL